MADGSSIAREGRQAARKGQEAATGDWLETFARVGYTAKGVVYVIVGFLAAQAAFGSGGSTTGSRGAIRSIADEPFGQVMLVLAALGLACYAVWRLVMAGVDPKKHGLDAEGAGKRAGYAVSGIIYGGLAFYAASIAFGWNQAGGGGSSRQTWTAWLLSQPFGQWLVGIVAVLIIGYGLTQFYRAYQASFMDKYEAGEMSGTQRTWAKRIGRLGLAARGVVLLVIGGFFIQAARQSEAAEAGGLGEALATLQQQSYGAWLLGLVALGLICYGIYCFSYARYRRFAAAGS